MFPVSVVELAQRVISEYGKRNYKIVTAESCTGGLIAAALTSISGSSAVVERGYVSYSNDAKTEVLGVMPELIQVAGSVSADVAEEMAQGALDFSLANVAVSVTGIAGPTGGTPLKPVGLVYFGVVTKWGARMHYRCEFSGDRNAIRERAVIEALRLLLSVIEE